MKLQPPIATGVVALALLVGCGSDPAPSSGAAPSSEVTAARQLQLDSRSAEAGSVTITATPIRLDDAGASIEIDLDTHSVELNVDLTDSAVLEVDGVGWPVVEWSGDGPGGHHRSGELHFNPGGPARGLARLTITGFADPVEVSWDLGAS